MKVQGKQAGVRRHSRGRRPNRIGGLFRNRSISALKRVTNRATGAASAVFLAGEAVAGEAVKVAGTVLDGLPGDASYSSLYSVYVPDVTRDLAGRVAEQAADHAMNLPGQAVAVAVVIVAFIGLGGITLALWRDLGERIRRPR